MPLKLLLISLFLIFSCNNPTESSDCAYYLDCAGICSGSSEEDACGVCGGDGSTCEVDRTWNIYYKNTSTPIAGFQFDVEGVTLLSASGGAAGEAGFTINTGGTLVLGFSLSGFTIPKGEGVLVIIEISGSGKACILADGLVVSSTTGTDLHTSVENCDTIQIP